MRRLELTASLAALITAAGPAMAQETQPERLAGSNEVVVLSDWAYEPLYESGWSIKDLTRETDVVGPSGDEIGGVENLIIRDDGRIIALIAEIGGFSDLGDTHVSIPWDEIELSPDLERVRVPIDQESADDYMLHGDRGVLLNEQAGRIVTVDEKLETGSNVFKATDLIGDYAYLDDGVHYGYVEDLLVRNGTLSAVVIDAQMPPRAGLYAYSYLPYGEWRPHGLRYELPYTSDEIAEIARFDYDRMRRRPDSEQDSSASTSE